MIPLPLETYMNGLRTHDIALIASSFGPGIRFVTPVRTMEREEILAFLTAFHTGFPDWHYDNDPPFRRGDGAFGVTWRQGGTHTRRLAFPDFPSVEPTGRSVVIPEQNFDYEVPSACMTEIRPDPMSGGAPRGISERILIALPPL